MCNKLTSVSHIRTIGHDRCRGQTHKRIRLRESADGCFLYSVRAHQQTVPIAVSRHFSPVSGSIGALEYWNIGILEYSLQLTQLPVTNLSNCDIPNVTTGGKY